MKKAVFILVFASLGAAYIVLSPSFGACGGTVVKILPVLLLMAGLLVSGKRHKIVAEWLLPLLALFFSACGDVAGNINGDAQFLKMMLSFAVAHVFYIISFARHASPAAGKWKKAAETLILAAYVTVFGLLLFPKIEDTVLKAGCFCYMALIGSSCLTAILQERQGRRLMIIGVALFIISDSLLVAGKFLGPVPCRRLLVMGTYYAAQFLINMPLIFSERDKKIKKSLQY